MRVTGGQWRRIVLGDVLAEHVLNLRGSGSFGSGRGRKDEPITLAGSHCLQAGRDPRRPYPRLDFKPVPAPRTRYEVRASLRREISPGFQFIHTSPVN